MLCLRATGSFYLTITKGLKPSGYLFLLAYEPGTTGRAQSWGAYPWLQLLFPALISLACFPHVHSRIEDRESCP